MTCPSIGFPLLEQNTRLKSTNSSPNKSFSSSMVAFLSTSISATVLGRKIFLTLVLVFGVFKTKAVCVLANVRGNLNIISFSFRFSIAFRLTRCNSFSTKILARPCSILAGEISTQSHVNPSSSPIRKEQEKARLIAKLKISSSQTSRALISVSAVQISLGLVSVFGRVACSTGLREISSHFTA